MPCLSLSPGCFLPSRRYNSRGSEITADARELKAFFVDSYQARVDRSNAEAEPEAGGANGAGSVGGSGRKKARGAKR